MKLYEGMFILRPDVAENQTEKAAEGVKGEITKAGGSITESTLSPKHRLAYAVKKHGDGYCLIVRFQIDPGKVEGLNGRLRTNPDLLRHMIVVHVAAPDRPAALNMQEDRREDRWEDRREYRRDDRREERGR